MAKGTKVNKMSVTALMHARRMGDKRADHAVRRLAAISVQLGSKVIRDERGRVYPV